MDPRERVDPELLPLLDLYQTSDLTGETLPAARAALSAMVQAPKQGEVPALVRAIPGPSGAPPVPLRIFQPAGTPATPRPAILHIHGGGFVMGEAAMSDAENARRAARYGAIVVSVDYRLAPETPFPGPLEDCYAALDWMMQHADALGIDPARVVVAGESAGGGLAAALAILCRDRGVHRLSGQFLIYPMIDDRTGDPHAGAAAPDNPQTGTFVWTREANLFGWRAMRGGRAIPPERIGHFAPARAADHAGLPPAFIATGALDLFVEENLAYAATLARAGVAVEMHVYPGAVHGFQLMAKSAVAQRFEADCADALARMLG